TKDLAIGIDDVPLAVNFFSFGRKGFHFRDQLAPRDSGNGRNVSRLKMGSCGGRDGNLCVLSSMSSAGREEYTMPGRESFPKPKKSRYALLIIVNISEYLIIIACRLAIIVCIFVPQIPCPRPGRASVERPIIFRAWAGSRRSRR